jgi:TetR/AcrR family transcriptional regulator, transcriptional repressor for nem operon
MVCGLDSLHTNAYVKPVAKKKAAPPPPETARDAAKQETREALIRAGLALFSKEGLDAPSLDAICARAGFTRGAFYVHFRDREDFIVAVMESATGGFLDALFLAGGQRPETLDLHEVIAAFVAAVSGGTFAAFGTVPLHQFLTACARSTPLRKRYVELLQRTRARVAEAVAGGQRAGAIRPDVDPMLAAGLLLAVALGVGTITEIKVPFDAAPHAAAMIALLAPR